MGFFDELTNKFQSLGGQAEVNPNASQDMAAVEKVLEGLPAERARYLAALALLLGRIAYADQEISEGEQRRMVRIFRDLDVDPSLANSLVELALQRTLFNSLEDHIVLRVIKEITQKDQRKEVMRAAFAVASDEDVSAEENEQLRLVAKSMGFSDREFNEIRLEFRDYIAVLRDL